MRVIRTNTRRRVRERRDNLVFKVSELLLLSGVQAIIKIKKEREEGRGIKRRKKRERRKEVPRH